MRTTHSPGRSEIIDAKRALEHAIKLQTHRAVDKRHSTMGLDDIASDLLVFTEMFPTGTVVQIHQHYGSGADAAEKHTNKVRAGTIVGYRYRRPGIPSVVIDDRSAELHNFEIRRARYSSHRMEVNHVRGLFAFGRELTTFAPRNREHQEMLRNFPEIAKRMFIKLIFMKVGQPVANFATESFAPKS
jgi:hypothetical protein